AVIRRAAQIHDLGNVSIPNQIWIKRGPLNPAEWSRVRLHPYHSQRIMSLSRPLQPSGDAAGVHHERLDGSGYHRGLPAAALSFAPRILVAAEIFQSMTEARAWRPARSRADASAELRRQATAGTLDRRAVDSVLTAAGERPDTRRAARMWPAGLTDREVEVLRLLARGHTNKEIAQRLHIAQATVHTHVINVYGKAAVSTRGGATLFALEHDLIQVSPTEKID